MVTCIKFLGFLKTWKIKIPGLTSDLFRISVLVAGFSVMTHLRLRKMPSESIPPSLS